VTSNAILSFNIILGYKDRGKRKSPAGAAGEGRGEFLLYKHYALRVKPLFTEIKNTQGLLDAMKSMLNYNWAASGSHVEG
jgi:hypothetical protein